jgi:hypothetical protein
MDSAQAIVSLTLEEDQQTSDEPMASTNFLKPLKEQEVLCDHVHESMLKKTGIIVQFSNSNAAGATSMIGGVRLGLTDIRKAPSYVARNKQLLKQHAMRMLQRHFNDTQCAAGAGEPLTADDFGLTFSLASVSRSAAALNPSRRDEGPLFYCLFSGLTEATSLEEVNWSDGRVSEVTYFINGYIHLLPQSQRRYRVIHKIKMDASTKDEDELKAKKAKMADLADGARHYPNDGPSRNYSLSTRTYNDRRLQEEIDNLRKELAALRAQPALNPVLPKSKGKWPPKDPNQGPDLPDDL